LPTVGILLGERDLRRAMRGLTHERLPAYQRAARRWGMQVVFFSPRGIRWRDRTVQGYVYRRRRYRRVRVPLPRVIHRRIIASSAFSRRVVRRLARLPGVRMFNPPMSRHKLVVHRKLRRVIARALPVTRPLRRPADALALLRRFRSVYVKPALGSAGRDVHRIDALQGFYRVVSWTGERQILGRGGLVRWLRHRSGRGYLVQQGINLARYRGRRYDIRVWVQRGADGRWQVTGMWPRLAARHMPVSNMAREGRRGDLGRVLRRSIPRVPAALLRRRLRRLALAVAQGLARRHPAVADLGLDLALDRRGKAWFLEANMRQQRWAPSALRRAPRAFMRQYATPMAHAAYLLGLTRRRQEGAGTTAAAEPAAAAGPGGGNPAGNGATAGGAPAGPGTTPASPSDT